MLKPGLMMDRPLLISGLLEHGAAQHATQEVVSRETHGPTVRLSIAQIARRARQLANALRGLGLQPGDAVASIAWNNHRHLEAYYAVSGSGMVMHTCNPRLHPEQLVYILNHAEDRVVLFDSTFAPLVQAIAAKCPRVLAWVCLSEREHLPDTPSPAAATPLAYEDLIAGQPDTFDWPEFDEKTGAVLCYTSGTTGHPKGVLYSHRSIVLNATTACLPDVLGLSTRESVLPVVPMFHINAWCIPYAAMVAGARIVLPGPRLDGASLYELMEAEKVTISAGVPTIWMGLLQHVEQGGLRFSTMHRTCVGGSAMPRALIEKFNEAYGVEVRHGWGMTETTAIATLSNLSAADWERPADERHAIVARQGKVVSGIEIKVVDEQGATLPRDGVSQGELMVRGQWIVERYHKADRTALVDGWFPTGDIATIAPDGVMTIRDRTKDVIKSGGEWISSIDLENAAAGHPAVAQAAVIGIKHPKWDERPLLLLVRKPGAALEKPEILAFLAERVAKWWVPEDVVFLDALPVGGTGKVQKNELRKRYGGVFSGG
ncbi:MULTISPECIES: long-chain-fatty-acid--CoA ligase [unclassified Hydrogenophaga]|uniref:long-chain-fatty-acid--CoA ligase n=1 Tax=unclassified Hydrogenophaga TaxID=2610897 RepID=UPI000878C46B|nr:MULTISPECIES: long-chain-fatty-acid--CoA ligase [unclassified Hydrogenophaga]MBN9371167.1 long-chain-fatty-acid--CoA ligase [Hydrogenophaga sp.]OJV69040.1 MAG: long-chain fatty acid--CoA ligase [Hydrogenophaga sp. 70-12]